MEKPTSTLTVSDVSMHFHYGKMGFTLTFDETTTIDDAVCCLRDAAKHIAALLEALRVELVPAMQEEATDARGD